MTQRISLSQRLRNLALMALSTAALSHAHIATAAHANVANAEPMPADDRLVVLEGSDNFRDLGGYLTSDGMRVKKGLLYRSDALNELSTADIAKLNQLQLKTLVDFRSHIERRLEPDLVPDTVETQLYLQIGGEAVDPVAFKKRFLSGAVNGEEFRAMMLAGNRQMVDEGEKPFGTLLKTLTNANKAPLVFHCAGGKDRTGLASAILLSLFKVPRAVIIDDYLLTNHYRAEHNQASAAKLNQLYPEIGPGLNAARLANRDYILAALNEIDSRFGGVEAYAQKVLKLSQQDIQQLRDLYLEPVH